jgi:hypothetical protein
MSSGPTKTVLDSSDGTSIATGDTNDTARIF